MTRETAETRVELVLELDGSGRSSVGTGVGFFDHLLDAMARHALFDLEVRAREDLGVDAHHLLEDVGICLGGALKRALGTKEGISRFGSEVVPMDEVLVMAAVDISGRPYFRLGGLDQPGGVGGVDEEALVEFLRALASAAALTLHVRILASGNRHHRCEAIFKAVGRALRRAVALDPGVGGVPSTKGVL